ncbi:hypothetical protein KR222_000902, partial [Zaprionus bogoriensis]
MILQNIKVFSTSKEALPINNSVIATIRTENNEPVYSKLYPHPMGVADFVSNEIKQLLKDGIIRPFRSPFNSPTWVVDKKGIDDKGNKNKRLVIDFRKLYERTIPNRYPKPSIPMILVNLGKAKFFTTLDLKSENFVADALSRQNVNALQDEPQSDAATIHSELSLTSTVETTDKPINCFRNQIILEALFGRKTRHLISFTDKNNIFDTLKKVVNPNVVNAVHGDLPTLACFQQDLVSNFPETTFWHC